MTAAKKIKARMNMHESNFRVADNTQDKDLAEERLFEANECLSLAEADAKIIAEQTEMLRKALNALRAFAETADEFNDIPGVYRCSDNVELWQKTTYKLPLSVGNCRFARAIANEIKAHLEAENG